MFLRRNALNMRPKGLECNFKKRKHGSICKGPGVGKNVAGLRSMLRTLWLRCRKGVSRWDRIWSIRL